MIEGAKQTELTAGAVGASGITLTFPRMLNDLLQTKFKVVTGYPGAGAVNLAMERGEVAARNTSWTSWKASKPEWIAAKDIFILVYSGRPQADLPGVPRLDDLVKGEDRESHKSSPPARVWDIRLRLRPACRPTASRRSVGPFGR